MAIVCFIPHATLFYHLSVSKNAALTALCRESGAKNATFVHVGPDNPVHHVRLIDPTCRIDTIYKEWANSFARSPVWVE